MHEIEQYGEPQQRRPRATCQDCHQQWVGMIHAERLGKVHATMRGHRVEVITEQYLVWGPTND